MNRQRQVEQQPHAIYIQPLLQLQLARIRLRHAVRV